MHFPNARRAWIGQLLASACNPVGSVPSRWRQPVFVACGFALLGFAFATETAHAQFYLGDASPYTTWIGSATTEGDAVMNADVARTTYGVDGSGVLLGLISDSFDGSGSTPTVATQIANGDLPGIGNPNGYLTPVNVLNDQSGGSDEGRAMLEIVHDVAPGASLVFHSAFNNTGGPAPSQTIADAINNLHTAGTDVIVDDVGILTAARFQDGPAAQAVDAAKAGGTAYFSSAGNSDNNAWRGTFNGAAGGTLNFGTNDVLEILHPGGTQRFVVQWADPYPSISGPTTVTDFALDITDVAGTTTFFTVDANGPSDDPYEFVIISGTGTFGLRIRHNSGSTDKLLQVSVFDALSITDVDDNDAPTVYGHAAAEGAISVAAHYFGNTSSVESFSSRGPSTILFDPTGNSVTESRDTPLLSAPDGVTTTTSGFGSFFGTSAAAPHAAAVAALMLDLADNLSVSLAVDDLYQLMFDSAVDMNPTGFDNASGWGRIDALAALDAVAALSGVPEPATFLLACLGAVSLVVTRRRRRAGR